jgi:L-seryl-tRNA(Ser) seleniumtransferase
MAEAAAEYIPLEFDLVSGRRGDRMAAVRRLLCQLTGAEDALVVNNNAAATLLMLSGLAAGREVILSRGEAVEIGGGFRIPEIMAQSGARLIEVGTTNRTYVHDYERAIGTATAALLKVHASNFRIIGFSESVAIAGLAALAMEHGLVALDDLGSGALLDTAAYGLAHEPTLAESIAAGATVVCASGDKLLGGPQAGILVGRRAAIERLRRHPLARAVRADKSCLAGLEATLRHYLLGEAVETIPVWRMIATPASRLAERAERWQVLLSALGIGGLSVRPDRSAVGGGSLPGETLPTWVLAIEPAGLAGGLSVLQARLRAGRPALVARVADGRLLVDPRTILPADDAQLPSLLAAALTANG